MQEQQQQHDAYTIRDAIAEALGRLAGVEVTGTGDGYSNGTFTDLSVKLPDGHELYILAEHSDDCEACAAESEAADPDAPTLDLGAETVGRKIEATGFAIAWTEAPHAGEMRAETWEGFDAILAEIAQHAPKGGAYHKTGFEITFEDGETYTGRYDVQNIAHAGRPDLRDHVRRFVGYHSGLVKPAHLTDDDYAAHLKMYGEETRRQWYDLARRYAVGVDTPDDPSEAARYLILDNRTQRTIDHAEYLARARELLADARRDHTVGAQLYDARRQRMLRD